MNKPNEKFLALYKAFRQKYKKLTVYDLTQKSAQNLAKLRKFQPKCLDEIIRELAKFNLALCADGE